MEKYFEAIFCFEPDNINNDNGCNKDGNTNNEDDDESEEKINPENKALSSDKHFLHKLATCNIIKECNNTFSKKDIFAMRNKRKN